MHYLVAKISDLVALTADLSEARKGESPEAVQHRLAAARALNEAGTHLMRYLMATGVLRVQIAASEE